MPRMTLPQLAAAARLYRTHSQAERDAKAAKKEIGTQLLSELARRNKVTVETDGVRITRTASGRNIFTPAAVRARLGARKAKRFIVEAVDVAALRAARDAGEITPQDLDGCIGDYEDRGAYPTVTVLDDTSAARPGRSATAS